MVVDERDIVAGRLRSIAALAALVQARVVARWGRDPSAWPGSLGA